MRLRRLVAKHVLASKMNIWYIASGTILVQHLVNLVVSSGFGIAMYCTLAEHLAVSRILFSELSVKAINSPLEGSLRSHPQSVLNVSAQEYLWFEQLTSLPALSAFFLVY